MQPDPAEAVRRLSTAEHLAARVAGMPSPSLLCTLHIGDSKLKSRATCDSTVLPRSPTDGPAPSGQRRCVIYPGNCYKRQAEAVRGGDLDQIAAITMATRTYATGGGFPDASLLLPAGRVHPVWIAQGRCSWHARRLTRIGRQRPL